MAQPHRARKRFGQHFLNDGQFIDRIVKALPFPQSQQRVLEIGPGLGAITEPLLARLGRLDAVELDRDLVVKLREKYGHQGLVIHQCDALNFKLADLLANDATNSATRFQVIGNLPYNISTPLLFHLLAQVEHIDQMVFMVQTEVAERLSATVNHRHYGRLAIMASLDVQCQPLFDVPPHAFTPPPKVQSTVISLTPRSDRLALEHRESMQALIALAFSQRRKTIRNSLKSKVDEAMLEQCDIDPKLRPENVSVEKYIALAAALGDTLTQ